MAKLSKQEARLAKGLAEQAARIAEAEAVKATPDVADAVVAELQQLMATAVSVDQEEEQALATEQAAHEVLVKLEAATAQGAVATGPTLHVKQGLALRGGRGEWYKLLCKYDGKPVADYVAAGKANPASHYTARSTKCGQPKTPESRLSWFKRAGIVSIG